MKPHVKKNFENRNIKNKEYKYRKIVRKEMDYEAPPQKK